jgi:metal-responsive CopG/Arc/MetJ family transcriptional regulator
MPPKTERFDMRLDTSMLERVDAWRRKQEDLPPRGEAIRRLVEQSLGSTSDTSQMDTKSQQKAAELASREIDRVGDRAATDEERAQRKRRLIKGPREFRELRGKSKR